MMRFCLFVCLFVALHYPWADKVANRDRSFLWFSCVLLISPEPVARE